MAALDSVAGAFNQTGWDKMLGLGCWRAVCLVWLPLLLNHGLNAKNLVVISFRAPRVVAARRGSFTLL